ncbi:periplasmic sensor signal transduction histidine kinase [Oceanicola granulosus HTCC2516]|uniref:histidine kinase n=2 Tax=Oceanicola granulosus TaxID=252302 RepID=Q2CIU4_OCEGH|nr:periplasmic sensor signal transduction histidine kinase [Oceanicola granulosus HTCC2516]
MSMVLLPLGLIAVVQTREYERESLRRSELALLALTERATASESVLIENAVGAASGLSSVIDLLDEDPAVCSERMVDFLRDSPEFVFAGFVPLDGQMVCSSAGRPLDMTMSSLYETLSEEPRRQVTASADGAISGEWVIVVTEPVFDGEEYIGWVSISIPHRLLGREQTEPLVSNQSRPMQMVTFNARGEVLSRAAGMAQSGLEDLPEQPLEALAAEGARAFTARNREGERRIYAVTPVVPDTVFALGVWDIEDRTLGGLPSGLAAVLFPAIMWIASLAVGSLAMHWLVIVHVQRLQQKMRSFGRSRRLVETPARAGIPSEFREMDAEFMAMAENVMRDEAQLENAVREKNILLKEIHHRVKNNLQLLSSITSMKRRKVQSDEARTVLSRLQDRILSLAAIHRNLYQSEDMSAVNAGQLIHDITTQQGIGRGGGKLDLDIDEVFLVPPQAVPFSLMLAETLSYGRPEEGEVIVSLKWQGEGVRLTVVSPPPGQEEFEELGLIGDHFIDALADQLGGRPERDFLDDGRRRLTLDFVPLEALPDTLDY